MPQCMIAFNELCEKIFPDDAVRQTNAVMGLSAFQHGDGLYGRSCETCSESNAWVPMVANVRWRARRFPARAVYRPCIVHLPIPH
jgi:hypothetical protein